jgi:hypothetical protein
MTAGRALVDQVREELEQPVSAGARRLVDAICRRHGDAVQAVMFYGSCLRDEESERDGILDFYVFVDRYRDFYASRIAALSNALLPPNVFFMRIGEGDDELRTKYSVVSLAAFAHGTSPHHFHQYFWARFSQPCRLPYARSAAAAESVTQALAGAVRTFVLHALPLAPERFRIEDLWITQFDQSYRGELRSERRDATKLLYEANRAWYERVTPAALRELDVEYSTDSIAGEQWHRARLSPMARKLALPLWRLRRVVGKVFSVLRLAKGALTFEGAIDYALWKIQRHSGAQVDTNWREKRYPLLALAGIFMKLFRLGAIR